MTHAEPQNLCMVYGLLFGLVCLIVGRWVGERRDPPSEG